MSSPDLRDVLLRAEELDWQPKSLQGLSQKMLWRDLETGASIALLRFEPGTRIPEPHTHSANQFMYCLSGRYEYTKTGLVLTSGSFYWNPEGHVHGPTLAHEETIILEIFDGPHYPQRPSWYDNDDDAR